MPLFRKSGSPYDLAVSMTGVKMGDRLLQLGCGDGGLLAALAAKVGLTGRACGLDAEATPAAAARARAAKAGVLVEIEVAPYQMLPFDPESFDLVVARDLIATMGPYDRVRCLQEARRVLRPGGRFIVIEPARRGGLGALINRGDRDPSYTSQGGAERALTEEGFAAVRRLAEREGVAFYEGVKARG